VKELEEVFGCCFSNESIDFSWDCCPQTIGSTLADGECDGISGGEDLVLSKVTLLQPLSVSLLTEISDLVSPGRMSVLHASGGRPGML